MELSGCVENECGDHGVQGCAVDEGDVADDVE